MYKLKKYHHTPPHLFNSGAKYFITASTYKNLKLFDDTVKAKLMSSLLKACDNFNFELEDWTILDNHYHIMVQHNGENCQLSNFVNEYHKFSALFIRKHNPDFDENKIFNNYWDTCITFINSYYARLNYIYYNSVKHGYVENPEDYEWCSYRLRYFEEYNSVDMVDSVHRDSGVKGSVPSSSVDTVDSVQNDSEVKGSVHSPSVDTVDSVHILFVMKEIETVESADYSKLFKKLEFTGTQVNYYFVCKRKLWLFSNYIEMERESGNVQLGKLLHENSYKREKKEIEIDNKIKIDFVQRDAVISEVKKSDRVEDAHVWQLKYYLYYLKFNKMIENVIGKIHYPKLKKTMDVFLEEEDVTEMKRIMKEIEKILKTEKPLIVEKMKICSKCAYFELCWI